MSLWSLFALVRRQFVTATPEEAVAAANELLSAPVVTSDDGDGDYADALDFDWMDVDERQRYNDAKRKNRTENSDDEDDDKPSKRARTVPAEETTREGFEKLVLNDALEAMLEAVGYQSDHVVSLLSFLLVSKRSSDAITSNAGVIFKLEQKWLPMLRRKAFGNDLFRVLAIGTDGAVRPKDALPRRNYATAVRENRQETVRSLRFSVADRFAIGLDVLRHVARTGDSSVLTIAMRQWLLPTPYLILTERLFDLFDGDHEDDREQFENEGTPFAELYWLIKRVYFDELVQVVDAFTPALFVDLCFLLDDLIVEQAAAIKRAQLVKEQHPRGDVLYMVSSRRERASIGVNVALEYARKVIEQWALILHDVLVGKALKSSVDDDAFPFWRSHYARLGQLRIMRDGHPALLATWDAAVLSRIQKSKSYLFIYVPCERDLAVSARLRALVQQDPMLLPGQARNWVAHWQTVVRAIAPIVGDSHCHYRGCFAARLETCTVGNAANVDTIHEPLHRFMENLNRETNEDLPLVMGRSFRRLNVLCYELFKRMLAYYNCRQWRGLPQPMDAVEFYQRLGCLRISLIEHSRDRHGVFHKIFNSTSFVGSNILYYALYRGLCRVDAADETAANLFTETARIFSPPWPEGDTFEALRKFGLQSLQHLDWIRYFTMYKTLWPARTPLFEKLEATFLEAKEHPWDVTLAFVRWKHRGYLMTWWFHDCAAALYRRRLSLQDYFLSIPSTPIDPDDVDARSHRLVCARLTHVQLSERKPAELVAMANEQLAELTADDRFFEYTEAAWLVIHMAVESLSTSVFETFLDTVGDKILRAATNEADLLSRDVLSAVLAHLKRRWEDALLVYNIGFPRDKPYYVRSPPPLEELMAARDKHIALVAANLEMLANRLH